MILEIPGKDWPIPCNGSCHGRCEMCIYTVYTNCEDYSGIEDQEIIEELQQIIKRYKVC